MRHELTERDMAEIVAMLKHDDPGAVQERLKQRALELDDKDKAAKAMQPRRHRRWPAALRGYFTVRGGAFCAGFITPAQLIARARLPDVNHRSGAPRAQRGLKRLRGVLRRREIPADVTSQPLAADMLDKGHP